MPGFGMFTSPQMYVWRRGPVSATNIDRVSRNPVPDSKINETIGKDL
jgi:hypothetical protein